MGSRSISYLYDKNGNLTSWIDEQATSSAASNASDPNHAATSANADVLSGTFTYDELNRQTRIGTTYNATNASSANAFTKTSTQSYTAAGRLKTRTDADGKSHTLSYDAAGRVSALALPSNAGNIAFPQYQWNQIKQIDFPSGVRQTYQYDSLMRPTEIRVAPPASGPNAPPNQNPLMRFAYQSDEVSNPTQIVRAFAGSPSEATANPSALSSTQTNYAYDKLYRLTNVIPNPVTSATPSEQYAYDLVHNRLAEQKSNHPSGLITGNSIGRAFTYNANHQLAGIAQLIQSINPANQTDPNNLPANSFGSTLESRAYSADGHTKDVNPSGANNALSGATVDQNRTYLYDASERLVEVKTSGNQTVATYRYDPFGRRVRKTVNIPNTTITPQNPIAQQSGTTFFGYASEGMIAEFKDNGDFKLAFTYTPTLSSGSHATWQTAPLYKRDTPFVVSPSNPSNPDRVHVFHNDHLGTPHVLTAINTQNIGAVTWKANYESFGAAAIDQTIVNAANIANQSATENQHRFPGQFFDLETGLAQNYHRDYEHSTGIYAQLDPLRAELDAEPYIYATASPYRNVDPTGEAAFLAPLLGSYARCVGMCTAQSCAIDLVSSALSGDCTPPCSDNLGPCLQSCLNPANWGLGAKGKGPHGGRRPPPPPPGDCPKAYQEGLEADKDATCSRTPKTCAGVEACIAKRMFIMVKCFRGGDRRHHGAVGQAWREWNNLGCGGSGGGR